MLQNNLSFNPLISTPLLPDFAAITPAHIAPALTAQLATAKAVLEEVALMDYILLAQQF